MLIISHNGRYMVDSRKERRELYQALKRVQRGRKLVDAHRFESAVVELRKAISTASNSPTKLKYY